MRSYHPRHIHHHFLRNLHIPSAFGVLFVVFGIFVGTCVFASRQINFHMVINPGTLSIGVVDDDFVPLSTPIFDLDEKIHSTGCQSTEGDLGTATQQIYIRNPDAAHNGWTATLSAASPQSLWSGDGYQMDFNDSASAGCADGADSDTVAGRMMVDFSESSIRLGRCLYACHGGYVTPGSSQYFAEGTVDTITLLSASSESSDMGDWVLQGTKITQTIPPHQSPSDNYFLDLYLSIISF